MATQREKGEAFQALHEGDAFVLPNAWDAGSARGLAELGFPALASTSGGFAQALGRSDGEVGLDETIEHTRELDGATELPVSIDLENGYGPDPADAARAIAGVAAAGAVGGSIEDWDRDGGYLYDTEHAAERVVAAAEAARSLDFPFTLTARAENHFRDNPDLEDTIVRLRAYEAAGADVLYAPGLRSDDEIRAVCSAVSKPVNVLAFPDMSLARLAAAGARRVSLGSWLAHIAMSAAMGAASAIRETGDFSALRPGNEPPAPGLARRPARRLGWDASKGGPIRGGRLMRRRVLFVAVGAVIVGSGVFAATGIGGSDDKVTVGPTVHKKIERVSAADARAAGANVPFARARERRSRS